MHNQEQSKKLGEALILVEAALGLSLLSVYDCGAVINDPADRQTAADAPIVALVPLLRRARDLLNAVT